MAKDFRLKLKIYAKLKDASIDNVDEILQSFGMLKLIASELVATINVNDINSFPPLCEEDDYIMTNGYRLLDNDCDLHYIDVYYGNNTKKILNVRVN